MAKTDSSSSSSRRALWLTALFALWLASKLAYILSPYNPWHELKCWTLQMVDFWLASFTIFALRPMSNECLDTIKDEFPRGTSWENAIELVELTPDTLAHFFETRKDALHVPWVVRGFLHQNGTTMDLTKYADVDYLRSRVNCSKVYNFDAVRRSERLTFCEAFDRMRGGEGLYMKFNRDFTKFEPQINQAVDDAAKEIKNVIGSNAYFEDSVKVSFLTFGDRMRSKIHNAMSDNWFFQITGMKDWKLYAPHQSIYLQPFNFPYAIAAGSRFDTKSVNGPKHLALRSYPGDLVYFPSFWLHEVDNVGEGLNLAIGLRPSISATIKMWMTALVPFYEHTPGTTGLSLCHLVPSIRLVTENIYKRLYIVYATRFQGLSEDEAREAYEEYDRNRSKEWWIKAAYGERTNVVGDADFKLYGNVKLNNEERY